MMPSSARTLVVRLDGAGQRRAGSGLAAYVRWSGATGMTLANNAVYCPGATAVNAGGLSAASVSSNYVEGGLSGATLDGLRFVPGGAGAAAFVDPVGFDFWPAPGSPLRGAASAALAPPSDFNGTQRWVPGDVAPTRPAVWPPTRAGKSPQGSR